MSDTQATASEKTANLTALQRELADLATRSKPLPQAACQAVRGPVLVIRGR